MKKSTKDLIHYFPLFAILVIGFIAFWLFSYDRLLETATAVSVAVSYFMWGVIHHHIRSELHILIVLEYLVVALLGLVIVLSLIFRI